MGHENCGAVIATLNNNEEYHIRSIVQKIKPSAKMVMATGATGENLINSTVIENIRRVTNELKSNPLIQKKLDNGKLKIVGSDINLKMEM